MKIQNLEFKVWILNTEIGRMVCQRAPVNWLRNLVTDLRLWILKWIYTLAIIWTLTEVRLCYDSIAIG